MKMRVRKEGYDWLAECHDHNEVVWCVSWAWAYEAIAGHAVMHHPRSS